MKYSLLMMLICLSTLFITEAQGQGVKRQQPNVSTSKSAQPNVDIAQFSLSRKSLNFGDSDTKLSFEVLNSTNSDLKFSLYGNADWFSASVINGTIEPLGKQKVDISVNRDDLKDKQTLELEVETKYGSKYITINVDKAAPQAYIVSCDKSVSFSIRSVEAVGDRVYVQFIMTNNGTDWGGSFDGGVFNFGNIHQTGEFRSTAARDNLGNIYPLNNSYGKRMTVKISGKTAYASGGNDVQSLTLNGGGSSVEGEIAIGGVDPNATMITEIKFGAFLQTAGTRRDFANDFVIFGNLPIKR